MGNTACHNNRIYLTTESHITGTYLTGNGIEHGINHTLERFFTGLCLGCNGNHIIHTKMCRKTTTTVEHLLDLKFAVLTAEAKVYQLTGWNGSGTFGTERTVAVESIVHINHFSLAMCTYGDTTTQMHYNDVQIFIFLTNRSGILTRNRLAVQGMENRLAFDVRDTSKTRFRHEFIGHFRVGNERRTITLFRQFYRNQGTEIARMLHFGIGQVVNHLFINRIDTTWSRFQQTATGNHRIKLHGNACLCQHIAHELLAVWQLLDDVGVLRQVFQRMMRTPYPNRFIVFIQSQLSRS